MRSFLVKLSDREEGLYSDTQVTQMFADGRVNRYTPCRKIDDKEWKTVDDYLPTLKYGTQLIATRHGSTVPFDMLRAGADAPLQKRKALNFDSQFAS
jgi:hypothetical protein